MNNVFHTNKAIQVRYDLKGSTQGRTTKPSKTGEIDPTTALKDLDVLENDVFFVLSPEMKTQLMIQIKADCDFFQENSIIDYSLLIGVHTLKQGP